MGSLSRSRRKRIKVQDKDVARIVDMALDQGWDVYRRDSKQGHLCFVPPDPDAGLVFHSTTTSDVRSIRNLRSQLRQRGLRSA